MKQLIENLLSAWNDPTMIGPIVLIVVFCLFCVGFALFFKQLVYRQRVKEWEARQVNEPVLGVCTFTPKLGYEPSNQIKMLDRIYE